MTLPALAWLVALVALLLFDAVRALRHEQTLSQWVWTRPWWARLLLFAGFLALGWHLFWPR
jgi:hypothetical protein